MGLPGAAPSPPPLLFLSLPRLSPSLRPLRSLESKFTECFPLTHWVQTKEVPPPLGWSKGLSSLFQGRGPHDFLVFLVPHPRPLPVGCELESPCVGGCFSGAVAGEAGGGGAVRKSQRRRGAAGLSPYPATRASQAHTAKGSLSLLSPSPASVSPARTKAPELPWQGEWEDLGPNYRPLPWKRSSLACRARLGLNPLQCGGEGCDEKKTTKNQQWIDGYSG